MSLLDAQLCYVDRDTRTAYFTTQPLDSQWGDDWDDSPADCNAGHPYRYSNHDHKEGREPWQIIKIPFSSSGIIDGRWFEFDNQGEHRSVLQINSARGAWLVANVSGVPSICAGTTLREFIAMMKRLNIPVWVPIEWAEHKIADPDSWEGA